MSIQKYPVNKKVLLVENAVSFYLLGAYMTDGNIISKENKLEINSKDIDWIKQIRKLISPTKPIYSSKRATCYTLRITDRESMEWLKGWGCTERKSKTLSLQKKIPQQFCKDFLRGVMDGDGSISQTKYTKKYKNKTYHYQKYNVYICSGSKQFIDELKSLIPSEIDCFIYQTKPQTSYIKNRRIDSKPMWRLIFNGTNAQKILSYIYYSECEISMKRKMKLANKAISQSSLKNSR